MKKTNLLIILLSVFSLNIYAQITAKEYGVLSMPSFFDTYVSHEEITKVYNEKTSLNELVKDSDSPLAWVVYSDRSKNKYLDDVDGFKVGEIAIAEPLVIYKVNGSWLEVGTIPIRENKKFVHNKLGWMHANQLILTPYAIVDKMGGPKKGMVLTTISSFDKTDDVMKILENKHYYRTPDLDEKSDNKARKFQFLFILKETNDAYLLSTTDNLSKSVNRAKRNIRGWLEKSKITKWNHRVCLEPSYQTDIVRAFDGKILYVIDEESHFEQYLEQGSLPNKEWTIREIELKNRRPFARQMRMPILADWDGTTPDNKKVAAIAQMIVENEDDVVTTNPTVVKDKLDQLAKLQSRLAEIQEKQNKINILFVLDGTISMKDFGPAISRTIQEFIKTRDAKLSDDKYRFALAVYRNYDDEESDPPLFEYIPFTGNVKRIMDKLENLTFDSKNKSTHDEAHYYGMINAINKAKFNPKETNVLVLVGDAGNSPNDQNGLNRNSVIDLLYEKNINLISYQVNYQDKPAYKTFNSDAYAYQKLLGGKHSSASPHYTGATFEKSTSENTFQLKFNAIDGLDVKEMYPIFGKLKYASKGSVMDVQVFQDNLVSSLDEYMTSLSVSEAEYTKLLESGSKEISADYEPNKQNTGEDEDVAVMTKAFEEKLRRDGFTEEEIEMFKRQGEISAHGFLSTKIKGIEEEAFVPVIFISKEFKDVLSDKLSYIASAKGMRGSKAREVMYNAIVSIMKSIVGSEVSIERIEKFSFNDVWMQVLGVPFDGDSRIKNLKIYQIKTELDDEEFLDFYSDFADDVEDFKKLDVSDKYSMWKKAGQTYYWIPLSEVPGCE